MIDEQSKLIGALAAFLHNEGHAVEQFETHLSWILVAGGIAYKFKKARHLDFVDYSSLEARRFYCNEELRLNRRFAPERYIDVVPVSMENGKACINGSGITLDYVIRMRAFDQGALWSRRIKAPGISADEIDQLATLLARIHLGAEPAPDTSEWGTMKTIAAAAHETFDSVAALCRQMNNVPLPLSERW